MDKETKEERKKKRDEFLQRFAKVDADRQARLDKKRENDIDLRGDVLGYLLDSLVSCIRTRACNMIEKDRATAKTALAALPGMYNAWLPEETEDWEMQPGTLAHANELCKHGRTEQVISVVDGEYKEPECLEEKPLAHYIKSFGEFYLEDATCHVLSKLDKVLHKLLCEIEDTPNECETSDEVQWPAPGWRDSYRPHKTE
jgi:hypothetical protein